MRKKCSFTQTVERTLVYGTPRDKKAEWHLASPRLGACMSSDSNSWQLCACPPRTAKAPQVLIWVPAGEFTNMESIDNED